MQVIIVCFRGKLRTFSFLFLQTGEKSGQVEKSKKNARQRQNDFKVWFIWPLSSPPIEFDFTAPLLLYPAFDRKWLRRWPIAWWSWSERLYFLPHCQSRSRTFMEAGTTRQISAGTGWRKSCTPLGCRLSPWRCFLFRVMFTFTTFNDSSLSPSCSGLVTKLCLLWRFQMIYCRWSRICCWT